MYDTKFNFRKSKKNFSHAVQVQVPTPSRTWSQFKFNVCEINKLRTND